MADFDPDKFLAEERAKDEERARVNAAIAAGKSAPIAQPAQSTSAPFNPDEFLAEPMPVQNTGMPASQPTALPEPGTMLPIAPFFPQSQGVFPIVKEGASALSPIVSGVGSLVKDYMQQPTKAVVDILAGQAGLPPPTAALKGYEAAKTIYESLPETKQKILQMRGAIPDIDQAAYYKLAEKLKPADLEKLGNLVQKSGGIAGITSFELPKYLATDPDALRALEILKTQAGETSALARIGGPLLRGAARVAGPAALAYDIYEAYPYYQAANVPQRLASGEVRANMATARQAPLNMPTPAPLSPQEAANLLASGDERLINIYGGVNKLLQQSQGQAAQQPRTNFIDQAMNIFSRYRGVPVR